MKKLFNTCMLVSVAIALTDCSHAPVTHPMTSGEQKALAVTRIDSLQIPPDFGTMTVHTVTQPDKPAERYTTVVFASLHTPSHAWGKVFIVESTYDFQSTNTAFPTFAYAKDYDEIVSRSGGARKTITVDDIKGYITDDTNFYTNDVYRAAVFPFRDAYVAVVFEADRTWEGIDPPNGEDVTLRQALAAGKLPAAEMKTLNEFDDLVRSLRFTTSQESMPRT